MSLEKKTILIVGHAKLPQGTSAKTVYDSLALAAVLDRKYGVIIQVTATLVTDLTKDYLEELLIGCSLMDGIEEIEDRVSRFYYGNAKNAIIAAVRDLKRKYDEIAKKAN